MGPRGGGGFGQVPVTTRAVQNRAIIRDFCPVLFCYKYWLTITSVKKTRDKRHGNMSVLIPALVGWLSLCLSTTASVQVALSRDLGAAQLRSVLLCMYRGEALKAQIATGLLLLPKVPNRGGGHCVSS